MAVRIQGVFGKIGMQSIKIYFILKAMTASGKHLKNKLGSLKKETRLLEKTTEELSRS